MSVLVFLLTILILIGIHEFGHFIAARFLKVEVLRFSIGFGKPVFRWRGESGTEYAIGWLPIGGYVRLLNSREAKIPLEKYSFAFDHQAIWRRAIIILAGPLINLIFAVFCFFLVYNLGVETIRPVIGKVLPSSMASKAHLTPGLEVTHVNNVKVYHWGDIALQLVLLLGEKKGTLEIKAQPFPKGDAKSYFLSLADWKVDKTKPELLKSLGIEPFQPKKAVVVEKSLKRISSEKSIDVYPQLPSWPKGMKYDRKYPVYRSAVQAFKEMSNFLKLNVVVMGKIITGKISFNNLGGPILIYQAADLAFNQGFVIFINFLGIMGVMLGFINLLPVPGLDGGHLLYFVIEKIRGKPLSPALEALFVRLGFILLVLLTIHVTISDLGRLLG